MANINIYVGERQFINFSPVSAALLRGSNNLKNVDLSYSNAIGQIMTAGQILYSNGTPGTSGYLEVRSSSTNILTGSGTVPIEIESYPSSSQTNQTVQGVFDSSIINVNLTYNSRPMVSNNGFTIDNRTTKNFIIDDFSSKFIGYDGNTLAEISITGNVNNYFYDANGNNNYQPYISGSWISVNNIHKLKFVAPDQNNYYVQTGGWSAKDSVGLEPTVGAVFSMAARDYTPSPVQYDGFGIGQPSFCETTEEAISVAFNNNPGGESFVVGKNYSNSQGYPAQTLRIEGYLDENIFKNNATSERVPTSGFVPKRLRNSATNTVITNFPYDIPISNVNQLTSELGGYRLMCAGNPNPALYTAMRYRVIYFRIIDSNGNIGPLKESIYFLTPNNQ